MMLEYYCQTQYASRYADDLFPDYPNFGKNLKLKWDCSDYYSMKIHVDDIDIFVKKVLEYKKNQYTF